MSLEQQAARYVYDSLGSSPDATRIVRLEPASAYEEPLRGAIVHATTLSRGKAQLVAGYTVEYDALSYAWGVPEFTKLLHCVNETAIPITETLYCAMKRLRATGVEYVWIDAISINQEDLAERTAQVKIMGNIFEGAKCVHVWLGEDEVETAGADALQCFFEYDMGPWKDSLPESLMDLIQDLLQRPFWSRRWVIQEIMLARDVKFHWGANVICGQEVFPLLFEATCRIINPPRQKLQQKIQGVLKMRRIDGRRRENHNLMSGPPAGLLGDTPITMFHTFIDYKCTEEMDIVYSLLGILQRCKPISSSPSFGRLLSSVDYKSSVQDAFIALARYHLTFNSEEKYCVPNLLECALQTRSLAQNEVFADRSAWPSWLPDWRNGSVYYPNTAVDTSVTCFESAEDARRGIWGSSAVDDASKCLSIVVLRGEEVVYVEKGSPATNSGDVRHQEHCSSSKVSFRTDTGYRGTGHPSIQPGDFIAYAGHLSRDFVPFVFRRIIRAGVLSELDQVVLVGDCVLQGLDTKYSELSPRGLEKLSSLGIESSKISALSQAMARSSEVISRSTPRPGIAKTYSRLQVF